MCAYFCECLPFICVTYAEEEDTCVHTFVNVCLSH
jgi:hypothetical protein